MWYNIPVVNCGPAPAGALLFCTAGLPASVRRERQSPDWRGLSVVFTKQSQNSTLRRLLCPLSVPRTACPCVSSRCRMAAVAALRAPAKIPISASTTPKKKPAPAPAETLGKDLAYFFSGDYLSACDLSTALGRLIPAVIRGDVKPRTARTAAYLAQTLLQTIHISEQEYINAFGTNGWRQSIRSSVYNYPSPPSHPKPNQRSHSPLKRPRIVIPSAARNLLFLPARHSPLPSVQAPQPPPAPASSPTSVSTPPPSPPQPAAQPIPAQPQTPSPTRTQPPEIPTSCHSERGDERPTSGASPESYREESAFSFHSSPVTSHSFTPSEAEGPTSRSPSPIHVATRAKQGRPLAQLGRPEPHPPRQQTPLESTLTHPPRNC